MYSVRLPYNYTICDSSLLSISSGLYKYTCTGLEYKMEHWSKGIRISFSVSF